MGVGSGCGAELRVPQRPSRGTAAAVNPRSGFTHSFDCRGLPGQADISMSFLSRSPFFGA